MPKPQLVVLGFGAVAGYRCDVSAAVIPGMKVATILCLKKKIFYKDDI